MRKRFMEDAAPVPQLAIIRIFRYPAQIQHNVLHSSKSKIMPEQHRYPF
jgi:hypothetical protein